MRIRSGDEVRTNEDLSARIDGNLGHAITIPSNELCTVLEATQEDITLEWNNVPDEIGGRVIYRGYRMMPEPFTVEKINLPQDQGIMNIVVHCESHPVPYANVLIRTPGKIEEFYQTNSNGEIIRERVPVSDSQDWISRFQDSMEPEREVFVAAYGYQSFHKSGNIQIHGRKDLIIELRRIEFSTGGSLIFQENPLIFPVLSGILTVEKYGDKVNVMTKEGLSVNENNHPVNCVEYGEPMKITDKNGMIVSVSIRTITDKSVLLDWWYEDNPVSSQNKEKPKKYLFF